LDALNHPQVLGLTGSNGSGKTLAAERFRKLGFSYFSLSDEIREELRARGETPTRDNLTRVGNELRGEHGADVLARRVMRKLPEGEPCVVDSIRNPSEVAALREIDGFRLLHFDAPREVRYQRAVSRADERTPMSFEEFAEQEDREMESPDETTQQLRATFALADQTILNDGTVEEFLERLIAVVDV
jgi:dephospho-CoA kinase